jgi:hypothetical protein
VIYEGDRIGVEVHTLDGSRSATCLVDLILPFDGSHEFHFATEHVKPGKVVDPSGMPPVPEPQAWMGACYDGVRGALRRFDRYDSSYIGVVDVSGRSHLADVTGMLSSAGNLVAYEFLRVSDAQRRSLLAPLEIGFVRRWPIRWNLESNEYLVLRFPN